MFGPTVQDDCRVQIILERVLVEECIHMHKTVNVQQEDAVMRIWTSC